MRRSRTRRLVTVLSIILVVAVAGFVATGLLFGDSWAGQMLQGASVAVEGEPSVFPSSELVVDASVPQGEHPDQGFLDTTLTFQGMWDGYCPVWGTDPEHPAGVQYRAGAFSVLLDGQNVQAYDVDLHHPIRIGDAYQVYVYPSTEPDLCAAQWILANYRYDNPAPGLSGREEGVAIQAALWHYVAGFEPIWEAENWCGRQVVQARAEKIIAAAEGQCVALPATVSFTSSDAELEPGQTANLTVVVYDQLDRPLAGQAVSFASSLGTLSIANTSTDAQGQANLSLSSTNQGIAQVSAGVTRTVEVVVADPADQPKPRLLVVKPLPYDGQATLSITWKGSTAVFLSRFEAAWAQEGQAGGVVLRWETVSENNNRGFNLYRGPGEKGPWVQLNSTLLPSQVQAGSLTGAAYEWLDRGAQPGQVYFYLLEDVATDGVATQHGPVSP
jgi:hypothetical protein